MSEDSVNLHRMADANLIFENMQSGYKLEAIVMIGLYLSHRAVTEIEKRKNNATT